MLRKHDFAPARQTRRRQLFRYLWAASYFAGIGLSVAMTVLACIWLGREADAFFDIAPNGTIAGIFLGFPVAIYSIYHQVKMHFGKKEDGE